MLDDELVKELCKLGLTSKQAKIYLSVVMSGALNVANISEKTVIHKQDIYKILPKLEKMGLLTRTITKPTTVEVIPVETALNNLIGMQKQKIKGFEETASTILAVLRNTKSSIKQNAEERILALPKDSNVAKNKVELVFKNAKKAYNLYIPQEICPDGVPYEIVKYFREFARHGVEVRIIFITKDENTIINGYRKAKLPPCKLTVKGTRKAGQAFFGIVDNEAWIPLECRGWADLLVTKNKIMANICKELFERVWNDPETRTLFQQEQNKKSSKSKRAQTIVSS